MSCGDLHPTGTWVNDTHSALNATRVLAVERPGDEEAIREVILCARRAGASVSVCGARHAMGGQQFGTGCVLLDTTNHARIRRLDRERGLVEIDAGIQWPELIHGLLKCQPNDGSPVWSIRQKQTGADALSLGGALAANVHGRGLTMRPIVEDVESFILIDAAGESHECSRERNAGLFALAIGGYGLFGVITAITLRLTPRQKLKRRVEIVRAPDLIASFDERISAGFLFGDFQFAIDETSPDFLQRGVLSCYRPVENDRPIPARQRALSAADWQRLVLLAHTDRAGGFEEYAQHYLATDGQLYWSDTHQLGMYVNDYHAEIDRCTGSAHRGSEMITELYVPRPALTAFLSQAADILREHAATVIYGTVRLIERDDETVLAWAREAFACIIFNLHVTHTPAEIARSAATFRALIALAAELGGSLFLTYHRYADRRAVETCYPRFAEFLRQQRQRDPAGLWQSDWLRHYGNCSGGL